MTRVETEKKNARTKHLGLGNRVLAWATELPDQTDPRKLGLNFPRFCLNFPVHHVSLGEFLENLEFLAMLTMIETGFSRGVWRWRVRQSDGGTARSAFNRDDHVLNYTHLSSAQVIGGHWQCWHGA
jgi:hypothetical protein